MSMFIVDAHLDLAYNALRGRDVLRPAMDQASDEEGIPSVGVPDLAAGGIGLICATIFCEPALREGANGYRTSDEAHAMAQKQFDWYAQHAETFDVIRNASDLPPIKNQKPRIKNLLPTLLLLEGADPLRTPADIVSWHKAGMRIVGLAWKRTRYAGGTGAPGPLTAEGVELVKALDQHRIIHDVSHLAEESFWQLLELTDGPVMASHSNCRSIVPTDRQLSDDMIRALVERDGVIGINFYDRFLIPPAEYGTRRATLEDVVRHVRHICDLAGNAKHVAIGTDMDGGFGRERLPMDIATSADLPKLADALHRAGFSPHEVPQIMGENWLRLFAQCL